MNKKEYEEFASRRVIHPATYCVRHNNGDVFEVQGMTLARIRKLIEAECHDRNWLMQDVDWFEKDSHAR